MLEQKKVQFDIGSKGHNLIFICQLAYCFPSIHENIHLYVTKRDKFSLSFIDKIECILLYIV